MVSGLVQGDDVPFTDQQRRQLESPPLTTAERADRGLPPDVGHQAADDVADPRITGPFVAGPVPAERPAPRPFRIEDADLTQRPDAQSTALRDSPGIRAHLTREQIQKTGFSIAVSPHDADAIAVA